MVEDQSGHYPFLTGASDTPRNGDRQHHQNNDRYNNCEQNYACDDKNDDEAVKSEISLIHVHE